jgi:hypothetical protein
LHQFDPAYAWIIRDRRLQEKKDCWALFPKHDLVQHFAGKEVELVGFSEGSS